MSRPDAKVEDRTMMFPLRTAVSSAALCSLLLTSVACGNTADVGAPAGPVPTTPAPEPQSVEGAGPSSNPDSGATGSTPEVDDDTILGGGRQFTMTPENGRPLVIGKDGKLAEGKAAGAADNLFVLQPVKGRHQIKAARPDRSGEQACLGLSGISQKSGAGVKQATVVATACDDTRDGQLWKISTIDDSKAYFVSSGGLYVSTFNGGGVTAVEQADGSFATALTFTDEGAAS
jgi:hypothetical protein